MTSSITDPDPTTVKAGGSYDPETNLLTVVVEGEEGTSLTAVYPADDTGGAAMDLLWQVFPEAAIAVVDDLEQKQLEAQADAHE